MSEGRLAYVNADITDMAQIERPSRATHEHFGAIDILFNNAAVFDLAPLLESDEAMFDRLFAVNVKGMFFVMQKVLAQMVAQRRTHDGRAAVVNMASQAGRRGEALVSHYCATKAAVISYTQSAALAMAPHRIRVNAHRAGRDRHADVGQVDALFARYEKPAARREEDRRGSRRAARLHGQARRYRRRGGFPCERRGVATSPLRR